RGRVLRVAQAVPQRRLLLGPHLPGNGIPDGLLHRALRPRPTARVDLPVGGASLRPRAEDLAPAPALHGRGRAPVRASRAARLSSGRVAERTTEMVSGTLAPRS